MLGKLIKHEFRATGGFIALICAGLLGFAGLTRLFMALESMYGLFSFPLGISMFFYVLLAIASIILVYIIIIRRFYTNAYGDEGYLTLTLPVRRSSVIFSKLVVGIVWIIVDLIFTVASICIVTYSDEIIYYVGEALYYAEYFTGMFIQFINEPAALLITEIIIGVLLGLLNSILIFYAAVSIGQLFAKHRLIGSVIGYVAVSAACQIVTGLFTYFFDISQYFTDKMINQMMNGITVDGITAFNMRVDIILYLVLLAIISAGLFAISNVIMKRAVNLQ